MLGQVLHDGPIDSFGSARRCEYDLITPTHAAATNARGLVERAIGDLLDEHEPEYLLKPVDHVDDCDGDKFYVRGLTKLRTEIARLGHFR